MLQIVPVICEQDLSLFGRNTIILGLALVLDFSPLPCLSRCFVGKQKSIAQYRQGSGLGSVLARFWGPCFSNPGQKGRSSVPQVRAQPKFPACSGTCSRQCISSEHPGTESTGAKRARETFGGVGEEEVPIPFCIDDYDQHMMGLAILNFVPWWLMRWSPVLIPSSRICLM